MASPTQSPPRDSPYYQRLRAKRVDPVALTERKTRILDREGVLDQEALTGDYIKTLRSNIAASAKSDRIGKARQVGEWVSILKDAGQLETKADYADLEHSYSHLQKCEQLALAPRMEELLAQKHPKSAMACYMLIAYDSRTMLYNHDREVFDAIRSKPWFDAEVTPGQIETAIWKYKRKEFDIATGTVPENFLDTVTGGDCFELTGQLPDNSIDGVITSPPYGIQRKDQYPSVRTDKYHLWFAEYMRILKPKMKDTGSVLVVLGSSVKNGKQDHYIWHTLLKVCDEGWVNPLECVIIRRDKVVGGSNERPRSKYEHVLWFCKTTHPEINMLACGKYSVRLGAQHGKKRKPWNPHDSEGFAEGIARVGNVIDIDNVVIDASGCKTDRTTVDHSAKMVPQLAEYLILTHTKPGDVVLDPFAGTGTTLLNLRKHGRHYVGFEIMQENVDLIIDRLANDTRYR